MQLYLHQTFRKTIRRWKSLIRIYLSRLFLNKLINLRSLYRREIIYILPFRLSPWPINFAITGIFPDDCRSWNRKPAVNKTCVNFQSHFTETHLEVRESGATTLGSGYQGQASLSLSYQQETFDALTCLATATGTDRKAVENLSETISTLTTELITTNE